MDNTNLLRCRTCLAQDHKLIPLSVLSIATLQLSDILMRCASIQIAPNDGFSQYACSECVTSAEKAYLFRIQCEQSNELWNELSKSPKKQPTNPLNENQELGDECERGQGPKDPETKSVEIYDETNNDLDIKSIEIREEVKTKYIACKYCFSIFVDEAQLSRHELAHTIRPKKLIVNNHAIYGCRECSVNIKTAESFVQHCHGLHEDSIENLYYRCKLCEGDFADVSQLTRHVSITHQSLRTRRLKHASQNKFECKACSNRYKSRASLREHLKKHARYPDFKSIQLSRLTWPQQCKYCEVLLKSYKERLKHNDQEHSDLKRFRCNKCEKTFLRELYLTRHMATHETKQHICQYCGKGFTVIANLKEHIRIHTGEKPFKCDKCDARFAHPASFRAHSHEEERNFECNQCHKRYKSDTVLNRHMRTHTVGPNYSCHLCPQLLKDSRSLRRHLSLHSNHRSFVCKECGKGFNSTNNLKQHMNTHAAVKPYSCLICDKGFTQSHCLRSHNARFHKDDMKSVAASTNLPDQNQQEITIIQIPIESYEIDEYQVENDQEITKTGSVEIYNEVKTEQFEQSDEAWNEFSKQLKEKPTLKQVTTSPNLVYESLEIQTRVEGCETDEHQVENDQEMTKTGSVEIYEEVNNEICEEIKTEQFEQSDEAWNEFSQQLKEKPTLKPVITSPNLPNENLESFVEVETPVDRCETDEHEVENDQEMTETGSIEIYNKPDSHPDIKSIEIHEHVKNEQFPCKYCFTIFVDEAKLLRHELAHIIQPKELVISTSIINRQSSVLRNKFECKICHKKYKTLDSLHQHKRRHHPKIKLSPLSRSTWPRPCNYCEVSLKSHKERMTHLDQEHGDLKSFSCDKCGKTFLQEKNLIQHAGTHDDVKKFMCQHCGRSFKKSSNLKEHMRIHTEEKKFFKCDECHKIYKTAKLLNRHMQTYVHERKYPCHVCSQKLTSSSSLRRHFLRHSNHRSFVCKECGKGFNTASNLKQHTSTHAAVKPYICSICNKGFAQAHCLRSHNSRFHKDEAQS